MAQEPAAKVGDAPESIPGKEELPAAPARVNVSHVAYDEEIRIRLQNVLDATEWFIAPKVRVQEGVVFLNGQTRTDDLKKWAGDLARNTQDVAAVANRMEVIDPPAWDFGPAWSGFLALWRGFIRSLPFFGFGLFTLLLSVGAGMLATRGALLFFRRQIRTELLRNVIARGTGVIVFLFGMYIVLRVSGLTQLALTVVGGTGLIGLAVGIAFREITENFLASIFLSMQQPFVTGDLVEVAGATGYVQQLNIRTTILLTLEGNFVQIPNATVYKSNLRNFTTNANRREDFVIGIGYDNSISEAQDVALKVLADHPAVLKDPEPLVLADSLGQATINLRVYFWLNGRDYSWLKVRSSVIRLVKRGFQKQGISIPDEAREIIFPQGVPVAILGEKPAGAHGAMPEEGLFVEPQRKEPDTVSTNAEVGLSSEADSMEKQARETQQLKDGENLLRVAPAPPASDKREPKKQA